MFRKRRKKDKIKTTKLVGVIGRFEERNGERSVGDLDICS